MAKKIEKNITVKPARRSWRGFWITLLILILFVCGIFVGHYYAKRTNAAQEESVVQVYETVSAPDVEEAQDKDFPNEICAAVENVLVGGLNGINENSTNPGTQLAIARVYARAADRGCPENSEKYEKLAHRHLEIYRALTDDKFVGDKYQVVEVIDTYKKIEMQKAAQEILEKAKSIADPAIDFIIEVEKIINE